MLKLITALLVLFCGPAFAAEVSFAPATGDVPSPERGFYRGLSNDFLTVTGADMKRAHDDGARLLFAYVRLDRFRTKPISGDYLGKISAAFARAAQHDLGLIVRFSYNFPENERDYLDAKDAKLKIVRQHIKQLAPIITKHRSTIAVLQAGFIGAWGEAHTSSNALDSLENKRLIMQELLESMPPDLQILWRYPADIVDWQQALVKNLDRVGQHNDCFLSSPTDVGTYDEDKDLRAAQRAYAAQLSAKTFYMGETCGASPEAIRASCKDILQEGAAFHVSSLNRDYYEGFFKQWKAEGCFEEVAQKLGYRLEIKSAQYDGQKLILRIKNDGWAKPLSDWQLRLITKGGSATAAPSGLGNIAPGQEMSFQIDLPEGADSEVCLQGQHPLDAENKLRFANAPNQDRGQNWNETKNAFCFRFPE